MLVDRYGKKVEVDDWFIRLDQNNEGRLYRVEGYPEVGKVSVHEHRNYGEYNRPCKQIIPVRLKQVIKHPGSVLWYPSELLPEIGPREQ